MRSALAPLREARFAWFYAARVVSTAGSAMAPVALTFAVLAITHSATALGLVLAARTVPMVLFILIGGVVSDRFSRTAVIRTANLLSGATQTVVAVLVITGSANLWTLVAIEALNGTVSAFTMPAMQGVVPQLVRREHLQPANALLSFSRSGLNIIGPFVDRLAYKHSLKEIPLDVPSQICITRDNTQLQVDGILYFQVTDPMRASYGSSNYVMAITQLAQTTLRSVIGKMELDKTFEEREVINGSVVNALDEAARNWGVKVLRYEIKDLTPPNEILRAMQAQITAEREKRALIAASEGRKQEQINLAEGARQAFISKSEGEKQSEINLAQGQASAIVAVANATADAIRQVAAAIQEPGGDQAVQLKVAEKAIEAFGQLAKTNNTMIVPANMTEVSTLVGTAMALMKRPAPGMPAGKS